MAGKQIGGYRIEAFPTLYTASNPALHQNMFFASLFNNIAPLEPVVNTHTADIEANVGFMNWENGKLEASYRVKNPIQGEALLKQNQTNINDNARNLAQKIKKFYEMEVENAN